MSDWYNYRLWQATHSPSSGVRRRLTRPSAIKGSLKMGDEREEEVTAPKVEEQPKDEPKEETVIASPPPVEEHPSEDRDGQSDA
jgi:hypothetical protein